MKEKVQGLYEHDKKEREKLKAEICEMIGKIRQNDVLNYIFIIVQDIVNETAEA